MGSKQFDLATRPNITSGDTKATTIFDVDTYRTAIYNGRDRYRDVSGAMRDAAAQTYWP